MSKNSYKLTDSTRLLADLIEGAIIDEENDILWSEQGLTALGCERVFPKSIISPQNHNTRSMYSSYSSLMFLLLLPSFILVKEIDAAIDELIDNLGFSENLIFQSCFKSWIVSSIDEALHYHFVQSFLYPIAAIGYPFA